MKLLLYMILSICYNGKMAQSKEKERQKVNIIMILADDLGYGDLGWKPFYSEEMKAVNTPNLKKMAANGMILSNFHVASPICSPSRASIMVSYSLYDTLIAYST